MASTRQLPDIVQSTVSHAQFVALPAEPRALPIAAPAVSASVQRGGFYLRYGKRAVDASLGLVLAVVLLPLIVAVALVVLCTSGWPVFYQSERVGRGGRKFGMWKFRTMVHDADAVFERWKQTHPQLADELTTHWKLDGDPRVTRAGRFLRRASLDELPQFWNVLRGEMSLVGPRPYLSRELIEPAFLPGITAVRPGLTGPFQVRGRKGLSPQARMHMEAGYAPSVGLMRDIGFLIRTVKPLVTLNGH